MAVTQRFRARWQTENYYRVITSTYVIVSLGEIQQYNSVKKKKYPAEVVRSKF